MSFEKLRSLRFVVLVLPVLSIVSALTVACVGAGEESSGNSTADQTAVVPGDDDRADGPGYGYGYGYGYGSYGYGSGYHWGP